MSGCRYVYPDTILHVPPRTRPRKQKLCQQQITLALYCIFRQEHNRPVAEIVSGNKSPLRYTSYSHKEHNRPATEIVSATDYPCAVPTATPRTRPRKQKLCQQQITLALYCIFRQEHNRPVAEIVSGNKSPLRYTSYSHKEHNRPATEIVSATDYPCAVPTATPRTRPPRQQRLCQAIAIMFTLTLSSMSPSRT